MVSEQEFNLKLYLLKIPNYCLSTAYSSINFATWNFVLLYPDMHLLMALEWHGCSFLLMFYYKMLHFFIVEMLDLIKLSNSHLHTEWKFDRKSSGQREPNVLYHFWLCFCVFFCFFTDRLTWNTVTDTFKMRDPSMTAFSLVSSCLADVAMNPEQTQITLMLLMFVCIRNCRSWWHSLSLELWLGNRMSSEHWRCNDFLQLFYGHHFFFLFKTIINLICWSVRKLFLVSL